MDGSTNRRLRGTSSARRLSRTLFPSDLERANPSVGASALRVAGRVLALRENEIELADAFSLIRARGAALRGLELGDLVVLAGRWERAALGVTRVLSRRAAPEPRGDGDFARLVFSGVGSRLKARSRALAEVRAYFEEEAFIEVETPLRVPAPGVDAHVEAIAADAGFLITSPELEMKRLVVAGVPRQFQFARVSRRDEAGALHEAEFTLLEWYRAFAGQEHVMRDTEMLVTRLARAQNQSLNLKLPDARRLSLRAPFERMSVEHAFKRYARVRDVVDLAASDEARYFELFVERVEPALARIDRPLFLHDYPLSQAALARPSRTLPGFAERFELYLAGVELCNGYGELTDAAEQRRRCELERAVRKKQRRSVYPVNQRFLAALEQGMPDTGGNALGFDRLLMLLLGKSSIQDVMAFPRAIL